MNKSVAVSVVLNVTNSGYVSDHFIDNLPLPYGKLNHIRKTLEVFEGRNYMGHMFFSIFILTPNRRHRQRMSVFLYLAGIDRNVGVKKVIKESTRVGHLGRF